MTATACRRCGRLFWDDYHFYRYCEPCSAEIEVDRQYLLEIEVGEIVDRIDLDEHVPAGIVLREDIVHAMCDPSLDD